MFRDRVDAGAQLARALAPLAAEEPVVLGLPRGGVPVAAIVARELHAPLDVIVVRKVGVPSQPELAMGAVGEDGARVVNEDVVRLARVSPAEYGAAERREHAEVERRARALRSGHTRISLTARTVIIVDDGIATGSTARVAIAVARAHGARRVVLAAPVAPPDAVAALRSIADEVVVVDTPPSFTAVGMWYRDFRPTSDADVVELLDEARAEG